MALEYHFRLLVRIRTSTTEGRISADKQIESECDWTVAFYSLPWGKGNLPDLYQS